MYQWLFVGAIVQEGEQCRGRCAVCVRSRLAGSSVVGRVASSQPGRVGATPCRSRRGRRAMAASRGERRARGVRRPRHLVSARIGRAASQSGSVCGSRYSSAPWRTRGRSVGRRRRWFWWARIGRAACRSGGVRSIGYSLLPSFRGASGVGAGVWFVCGVAWPSFFY